MLKLLSTTLVALLCLTIPLAAAADDPAKPSPFDGKTLDGWVGQDGKPVGEGWEIVEGEIHRLPGKKAGNILTAEEIGDFELSFDWKIAKRGNSGLKYRVQSYDGKVLGLEYQIFDDGNEKAKIRDKNSAGSLYDLFEPNEEKDLKPPGEYNSAKIVVHDDKIEHWLNGKKIVSVTVGDDEWTKRVKVSKFNDVHDFSRKRRGKLMLTDHGSEVWYKNFVFTPLVSTLPEFVPTKPPEPKRPNIIFVLVDDMGYGDLGCYGGDISTPNIDRIAKEGVKFTDFYANAPVCSPTRCGFMTGRWQQRVGLEWAMGYTAQQQRKVDGKWVDEPDIHGLGLPTGETTVAQMLKSAGYATGALGKWHLGFKPEYNPTRRGFDEYFGTLLGHSDYFLHQYFDGTNELRDGEKEVKVDGYLTDLLNERAVKFIQSHAQEPFFLYLPHQAVHAPYQPPGRPNPPVSKEGMNVGTRADYAAMLRKIDDGIGQILAELEKQEIADDTLIVLSSDNGGAHFSDNGPLFNGKQSLWEGGIRVPCVMRWPARLPKGKTTKQVGITMDLTATFVAAAGAKPAKDRPLDGIDLLPMLTGKRGEQQRTLCWRIDRDSRKQKAVRHGDWKYVHDGGYLEFLYNLKNDIGERKNQAFREPKVLADLKKRLADWEANVDAGEKEIYVH